MEVDIWETLEAVVLTPEHVRSAFDFRVERGSLVSPWPLFLPAASDISLGDELNDVITRIDATDLEGFRLVRRGNAQHGVSELHRATGRIVSSREFSPQVDISRALVHQFLDCLADRFRDFCQYPGFVGRADTPPVAYSAALARRLLLETMTAREQPRVIPRLTWPHPDALMATFTDIVAHLPLSVELASSTFLLEHDGAAYRVREVGDRGEALVDERLDGLERAMSRLLEVLFSLDQMNDDARWTFAPTSLVM